jgi:hypothetical protein
MAIKTAAVLVAALMLACARTEAQSLTNPYDPSNATPRCQPGTSFGSGWVCDNDPIYTDFASRQIVGQASIFRPGKEWPYVILTNLESEPQYVLVEYYGLVSGNTYRHRRTIPPFDRLVIDLRNDPAFVGKAFFSATAYFSAGGSMEMAWHRAGDFVETATQQGKIIPR